MDYVTITGQLENEANMFIRYIKTPTASLESVAGLRQMKPPNTIRGLSAALFTEFYQKSIPAVVFILYHRHSSVSSDALKLIQQIFDKTQLKQFVQPTEKNEEANVTIDVRIE